MHCDLFRLSRMSRHTKLPDPLVSACYKAAIGLGTSTVYVGDLCAESQCRGWIFAFISRQSDD